MPVYNGERFVAEAIESILQQTVSDFEFLIVDDGSTDRSLAIIQDYAERDPRIRYFHHPENRGVAAARNKSLKHAAGKYVALMDSDDVCYPQRIAKQAAYLETHAEIGGVGVIAQNCDKELRITRANPLPARHHAIVLHTILHTRIALKSPTMMIRRDFFDTRPVHKLDLVVGSEEEMLLRLVMDNGIRYANLQEELYLYRRHSDTQYHRHQAIRIETQIRTRHQALRRLGEDGMRAEWIVSKHPLTKLSWRERQKARRDITRLIEAMVAHNWVDACDEPLLYTEMEKLVESTAPRNWQMFLHWYRHRIARHVQP